MYVTKISWIYADVTKQSLLCLQGKSALWSHLQNYVEMEEAADTGKQVDPNLLSPGNKTDCHG